MSLIEKFAADSEFPLLLDANELRAADIRENARRIHSGNDEALARFTIERDGHKEVLQGSDLAIPYPKAYDYLHAEARVRTGRCVSCPLPVPLH